MMLPDGVSVMLILKQANKSRPNGEWRADDYDVFDGGFDLTRIVLGVTFRHDALQRPHEPKSYRAGIS